MRGDRFEAGSVVGEIMGSKHDIAEALLNRLRNLARDVSLAIAKKDVDVAKALSAQMQFLAELLSLSWPVSGVPSPLNDLLRHVYFVNYYVIRTGWESAEGNANDFPKDLDTLVAKLSALQSTTRPDLWTKVDSMPDGFSK